MSVRVARWSVHVGLVAFLLSVLVVVQSLPARADYTALQGDGSSWSAGIINQWISDAEPMGMRVDYTASGSSAGRKSFATGQDDFAVSEIPFQGTDPVTKEVDDTNRDYAYLPIVAGGTAFTYHVEQAGELMREVRLSGATLAKIFTNQITNWNDAAIKADNNGREFPDLEIAPVVRSDGSGTTAQFTRWLDAQYPALWKACNGQSGLTSYYPICDDSGRMVGQSGSDGVMNKITSSAGNGTIGYVEYSYALNADYPVVKVLNAAGYYVEPTAYNVAVALTKARINEDSSSKNYLTQILDDVYTNADPRAYPLSSYSYLIMPTGADDPKLSTTSKRQTLVDFMSYALCTGQVQAAPYGYSPMPLNLVQAAMKQLVRLKEADPNVSIAATDVTACGNPTFIAGDLSANCLATIAPMPYATDKEGAGPNLTGSNITPTGSCLNAATVATGTTGTTTGTGTTTNTSGTSSGTTTGAGTTTGTGTGSTTQIDPETGLAVGDTSADGSGSTTGAVATTIAARPASSSAVFGALSAAELVA
ncbi:MAG: phosphate ABC transporter substrate-binding protein PstS, partial [Actinobacteria bacterium]|nr:phosphate ABC transporter substrate-binding protein PstS [Actinomycetota bacterium]